MITLNNRQADLQELKAYKLDNIPLLDTLKVFWTQDEESYLNFLEEYNIDYYHEFKRVDEIKEIMNAEIAFFNKFAEKNEESGFDFKAIQLLKKGNLKQIQKTDFFKFTLHLNRIADDKTRQKVQEIFFQTPCISLVSFKEAEENFCSLYYHKRGAFYYHDKPYLAISREQVSLLELYEAPKDNNFIVARFLLDLCTKLKEEKIEMNFGIEYSNGFKAEKNVDEILEIGRMSLEEKKDYKEKQKIHKEAKEIAKQELKDEQSQKRQSLNARQNQKELEKSQVSLYNAHNQEITEENIEEIITKSLELYEEKEIQKTKERLAKAKKDSYMAYQDLKEHLNRGVSLLEGFKILNQKYRNEDTTNFASILLSEDILNLSAKDKKIQELEGRIQNELQKAYKDLEKKEETISKLRGTLQIKINEMSQFEHDLEQSYKEKFARLESEVKEVEESYEKEVQELTTEKNSLILKNESLAHSNNILSLEIDNFKEKNITLTNSNQSLQLELKYLQDKTQDLESKLQKSEDTSLESYKKDSQIEILKEKESMQKARIQELEGRIHELEEKNKELDKRMSQMLENILHGNKEEEAPIEEKRNIFRSMR